MRVIITGGRDYTDEQVVRNVINSLPASTTVIHGDAPGADTLAATAAIQAGLTVEAWPADWRTHGRGAGPRRNQAMLDAGADAVWAFPGGRGTADMVRRAREAGVPVFEHV
jgi:hypothetical protein